MALVEQKRFRELHGNKSRGKTPSREHWERGDQSSVERPRQGTERKRVLE